MHRWRKHFQNHFEKKRQKYKRKSSRNQKSFSMQIARGQIIKANASQTENPCRKNWKI